MPVVEMKVGCAVDTETGTRDVFTGLGWTNIVGIYSQSASCGRVNLGCSLVASKGSRK